ncbi:PREDICTED: uncharacterized protein LOC109238463 [Nicotiana attenuata]|uniref:uncharacterized protein LOC109238463 n=1 Tax=Nicotiana attenuata TaxID=49451 RepID=UPI000904679C|nr:PREDICTED: uncharacterized protein LOC109238463 [Nicotiana attenuata]
MELIQKFGMNNAKSIGTPMSPATNLDKDEQGTPVDETKYRGMIGSLLYLTASRPYIMFSMCKCARFQSAPKESHLTAVKRIIRYLIGTVSHGLCSQFEDGKPIITSSQLTPFPFLYSTVEILCLKLNPFSYSHPHLLSNPVKILPSPMAKHSKNPSASTRKSTRSKVKPPSAPPEQVDLGSDHSEGFVSSQGEFSEQSQLLGETTLGK